MSVEKRLLLLGSGSAIIGMAGAAVVLFGPTAFPELIYIENRYTDLSDQVATAAYEALMLTTLAAIGISASSLSAAATLALRKAAMQIAARLGNRP